jgi:hypothetical protein
LRAVASALPETTRGPHVTGSFSDRAGSVMTAAAGVRWLAETGAAGADRGFVNDLDCL